ncbi:MULTISPECIES: MFS transporter [unclassified Haematobacter]|uniref:MFS transporter n=1 Tax=unclassified Haematobacter TaxID=2640585 RepID=UPI0025B7D4FE|nr:MULTISPECIES: MFS transporter [unclassified Haematobacter]
MHDGRVRRFAVLAVLYLAQGVPAYVLVAAVPPILRDSGVSRAAIGMLSLLLLPLAVKFLWAPLVERFRPLPLGRRLGPRRAWILPTQIGTALCLFALSFIQPTDILPLAVIGLLLILLASTQDIATDGYAVLSLSPGERPTGNAIQGAAVAASVLVGGTLGLVLYHHFGWRAMMLTMAAATLLPLLVLPWMREDRAPPVARPRPRLRTFLARPEARQVLWLALFYRASEGLVKTMEGPYLVDAGMPLDWIGYLSGAAAATVGLGGSALALLAVHRRGALGTLVLLGSLRSLCFAVFALHAFGVLTGLLPVGAAAVFQTLIRYMEIVALYSLFMQVCSSDQPGTDFTLLACAQMIVYQIGGMASGLIAEWLGYAGLFTLATLISMAATWGTRRQSGRQRDAAQTG